MKALVFDKSKYQWESSRGFDLAEVPKPKIEKDDDLVIKVHYAGVCGSDKGIWYRTAFRDQILGSIDAESQTSPSIPPHALGRESKTGGVEQERPLSSAAGGALSPRQERAIMKKQFRIIGHEFFGEVVEIGKAVKNIKKGDFVSCESHVVDNKCFQCLKGQKNVCTNEKILGISQDGGFAEFVKVPAHIVWKTDTSKIRPEVAAVQEPFGNAVHAASKVDLKGKTLAIFGLGPIGLFLLLIAKGMGAKEIIGVEPNPVAIEMAKRLGIDFVIPLNTSPHPSLVRRGTKSIPLLDKERVGEVRGNAHNPAVTDEIMKITNGVGVDVSFEMAGFNDSFNNAIFATRRGGNVILFGIKTGDFVLEDYNRLIVRGLTLHAIIGRQIWKTWETTRKLLEDPKNKIQEQIYKIILNEGRGTILPISEYTKERFEKMIQEHPKILLQF